MDSELQKLLELKWDFVENDPEARQRLIDCYVREHKDNPCCISTLQDYFRNHKQTLNNKNKYMIKHAPKSENYALREGMVLRLKSENLDVSNYNLTDEIALALLQENPKNRNNFAKLPEDNGSSENNSGGSGSAGGDDYSQLSKGDMYKMLKEMQIDEKEFIKLNKADLLAFLLEKKK